MSSTEAASTTWKNQTIAYLGDAANNMANSYLLGGAVAGMWTCAWPAPRLPAPPDIVADAKRVAAETGGSILVTTGCWAEAVKDADCVFTDTRLMGEAEYRHPLQTVLGLPGQHRTYGIGQAGCASSTARPPTAARKSPLK